MSDELQTELAGATWIPGLVLSEFQRLALVNSLLPIVSRRIAQARADAWSEGYSDGRNDEHQRSIKRATNPYRQHAAPGVSAGNPDQDDAIWRTAHHQPSEVPSDG